MVDGTFLKLKYRGVLMIEVAKDGNNNIFPLAFGIADSENNDSYRWFFTHLKFSFGTRENLSILSDFHSVIANAISQVYPDCQHGICIYHMEKNLQKYFPSEAILALFYNATTTYKRADFESYMTHIREIDPKFAEYIKEEPPERWAGSFHTNRHYNMLTTNNVETIKSVLRKARALPVENITAIKFVMKYEGYQYNVNLKDMSCDCLEFQTDELPCTHAMAVIEKRSFNKSTYCSDWFKKQAWQETYKGEILSVGNEDSWVVPQNIKDIKINPPDNKIRRGRNQTKRYRPRGETTKYTYRYGICKLFRHSRQHVTTVELSIHMQEDTGKENCYKMLYRIFYEYNIDDINIWFSGKGKTLL
ncbi:uncharacterized protein LOC132612015 [Lycium barbarum]|uniref:uncharacterized protein LOC132612015 n=1 Tax=Lycium barbarum TaxID=112863 RepID=UPI00293F6F3B|nr:uncharacterized protein LOC132612015 [Lycium barbarum]